MMRVLQCEQVREDLTAYCDGELSLDDQVRVENHLQECIACRLEATSIAELGDALRVMAGSVPGREHSDNGRISAAVLDRVRVERQFSIGARVNDLFQDMHLVWAGLGASHQTGWTGLIAPLLDIFGRLDAKVVLETQRERLQSRMVMEQVTGRRAGT